MALTVIASRNSNAVLHFFARNNINNAPKRLTAIKNGAAALKHLYTLHLFHRNAL